MAAPVSLGMLSTFLFQIVDTYFVGQLGSSALAALSFSTVVYFVLLSIFMGLSVGTSAVVAKSAGKNEREESAKLAMAALLLTTALSVGLCGLGLATIDPMFIALGADSETLPLIGDYMSILFLGLPFLMVGIVGSSAVCGLGVVGATEAIFGIAGVINLVFDYLLIFGIGPFPEMSIAGAALASAISFLFIAVAMLAIMQRHGLLSLRVLHRAKEVGRATIDVLRLGLPTIAMQSLVPITGLMMTFVLATFGAESVAAFGVASRIETLAMVGIFALSSAITPFVAQNFGAANHDRIDKAALVAGRAALLMGIVVFVILSAFGAPIARIFSDDPAVVFFVSLYFRIVAVSYGFIGLLNMISAILIGLQLPRLSLRLMLVKTFVLTVPLLAVASFFSATAIFVALSLANVLSGIFAVIELRRSAKRWNRPVSELGMCAALFQP
jgi:putative MATE family efflux protein